MHSIGITIVGGLHDGAILGFVEGVPRRLGSGADVDILLVDEAVAECQCSILWRGGDVLELEVLDNGMAAYGTLIDVQQKIELPVGAVISISVLQLRVVCLEGASSNETPQQAQPHSDKQRSVARRQVLKQLGWLLYVREMCRPGRAACWMIGGIMVASAAATGTFLFLSNAPGPQQLRADAAARVQRLFPAVKVSQSGGAGTLLYEGFVRDQHELNQLRSIALGMDSGRMVLRVVPMDVFIFNASMWLDHYYLDPDVQSVIPGELQITVGSALAIKTLEGWDFSGVGKRLMRELPELTAVRIVLAQVAGEEIELPAAQMGISFVPTSDGSVFVIGDDGAALFAGAATREGRIDSISGCSLLLDSRAAGARFRMTSRRNGCGDKDVTPRPAAPPVD